MLSRSQEFFKYIVSSLPVNRLKEFWLNLAKQDTSYKDIVYKMLNECSKKLRETQMDAIISNLSAIEAQDINEDMLEFFSDIASKEERQTKVVLYLWGKVLDKSRDFRPKMKDRAI